MQSVNQAPPINRAVLGGLLFFAFVSLVLQIVGLSTTGWAILFYGFNSAFISRSLKFSIGLWRAETCIDGKCESEDTKDFLANKTFDDGFARSAERDLDQYRAETILGVIFIFIAIILTVFLSFRRVNKVKVLLIVICACSTISALTAAIATGKFGKEQADSHRDLGKFSPYLTPYSIILTGVGAVLAAIVAFIALLAAVCLPNNNGHQQQQPTAMANTPYLGQGHTNSYVTTTATTYIHPPTVMSQGSHSENKNSTHLHYNQPSYYSPSVHQPSYSTRKY